jgi:hypothetical protein
MMKKLRVHPPSDTFVLGGRLDTAPANPTVLCCTVNAARIAADTGSPKKNSKKFISIFGRCQYVTASFLEWAIR